MDVEFAVLADYAANTQEGKLVIGGIFDTIFAGDMPVSHPMMALALRLHAHPGEEGAHTVRVRLVDPDGHDVIQALEAPMNLSGLDTVDGGSADMVLQMAGVTFTTMGRHSFDIFVDNRFERSVTLFLKPVPQPGAAEPPNPDFN